MKVKAVRDYNDLKLKRFVKAGTVLDMPEERAKELSTTKNASGMVLVEIIEEQPQAKRAGGKKNV